MENSPPAVVEGDLSELVSSINERLTSLEAKVTKLSSSHEQGKTRLEEVQEFSENIVTLQERRLAEIEENMKDQKKLVGEIRVHLQNLQNSRVNHKDVLIRHENQTKKLIELVNDISEKQNEYERERSKMEHLKAKRFSTFEARGRTTHRGDLYDFEDGRSYGRGSGHHHHRRTHSTPSSSKDRRRSGSVRRQSNVDF